MKRRAFTPTVYLHQITTDEEGTTHAEDPSEATGWEVYLRKDWACADPTKERPFDIEREADFEDEDEARAAARRLAEEFQCEIEEY